MNVFRIDENHVIRLYSAHGLRMSTNGDARCGYTGEVAESDLDWYLLGERLYVPCLRCFISPDPASPFAAGGFSRYAYCSGDPINRVDPSGNASFTWLGKLLGTVWGAMTTTAGAIAHATPAAAITTFSRMGDIGTATVTIGAMIAGAAGDEQTAGMLGMVGAGFGGAAIGLGVAGQAFRKNAQTNYVTKAPPGTHDKHWVGKPYSRETFPLAEGRQIKHYIGAPALDKFIARGEMDPARKLSKPLNSFVGPAPDWTAHTNRLGGVNFVADTPVNWLDEMDQMHAIRQQFGSDKDVLYLVGAHGSPNGINWANGQRLHTDKRLANEGVFREKTLAKAAGVRSSHFHTIDISVISNIEFAQVMEQDAYIVHGYCYGAVDREVMHHFGVTERTMRVFYRG